MSLFAVAEAVSAERKRRSDLLSAVFDVVERADPASGFALGSLRRHLSLYYGKELAEGATVADLLGAAASAGGCPTNGMIWNVRLRKPSREARRRVAAKWNAGLPTGEITAIRRLRQGHDDEAGKSETLPDGFVDIASLPEGSLYQGSGGVFRQVPPKDSAIVTRDGGDSHGHTVARRRRFPTYIEKIRAFLDGATTISIVDRQILEHVVEGRTLRWISDELGMKKATIHKRVAKIRREAGIAGPGPGR